MSKPNSRTNQKMTNDKFWQFRNLAGDDQKAELLLYGDISERSWWEDAATPKRFADDLAALGDVKEITVYINSGGGDVFAAQAIGNMLERNAATVTAHIDGLCASAATIVACHADKVVAAADSSYMVHPVSMGVCDYLTAEDLNNCLKALETIRSSIVTLYAKKSGKTEDECAKWMDVRSFCAKGMAHCVRIRYNRRKYFLFRKVFCYGNRCARCCFCGYQRPVSYTHLDVYKRQAGALGFPVQVLQCPLLTDDLAGLFKDAVKLLHDFVLLSRCV